MRSFVMFFVMVVMAASANADVITERKENFRANVKSLKLIQPAMEQGDMETISKEAESIASWAKAMPEFFPQGSDMGNTKARPEIWENWDDFLAKSAANREAAETLAELAAAGNDEALFGAFGALSKTCGDCHKLYKY